VNAPASSSVHDSIRHLDALEWDRLAGDNAFATHAWLLTIEASWRAAAQPRYFTLRRDGALVAGSVCYVRAARRDVETLDDLFFGRLEPAARAMHLTFLPALVCGPALGYGWHIGVDPALGPDDASEARRLVLDAIEGEARKLRLRLSFVHLLGDERELKELLEERGFLGCRNVPVGVLDLRWSTFDDYLSDLPGKSRVEFRRQIKRNSEGGTDIAITDVAPEAEERLSGLLDDNARKHGGRPFACNQPFFAELKRNMGAQARVFAARRGGAVTGVLVVLERNATAFAVAVGVDPATANDYTYFRLTYYSLIAHAIQSGTRRLYYGRGMYEVKVRRGCRLADTWIYPREPGLRRIGSAAWFAVASAWNRYKMPPGIRRSLMD
jgi:predicted N-acyltransferase